MEKENQIRTGAVMGAFRSLGSGVQVVVEEQKRQPLVDEINSRLEVCTNSMTIMLERISGLANRLGLEDRDVKAPPANKAADRPTVGLASTVRAVDTLDAQVRRIHAQLDRFDIL